MIHYQDGSVTVHAGDCLDVLREMADASVDAVVTDPPYGLGFMGRDWDSIKVEESRPQSADEIDERFRNVFPRTGKGPAAVAFDGRAFQAWCQTWATECLRVLKPGGHMLAFGGTRTWHRLACAIEDAGFEIRDSIHWIYGSGFPKSLDVSKAIDRARNDRPEVLAVTSRLAELAYAAGITRADLDERMQTSDMGGWWLSTLPHRCACPSVENWTRLRDLIPGATELDAEVWRLNGRKGTPGEAWAQRPITQEERAKPRAGDVITFDQRSSTDRERRDIPATDDARTWEGWGTALKPSHEPIVVARKPLTGTVAGNVLRYGTSALNVDACRVEGAFTSGWSKSGSKAGPNTSMSGPNYERAPKPDDPAGRWPPNVVLSPEAAAELDRQSGTLTSGRLSPHHDAKPSPNGSMSGPNLAGRIHGEFGDDSGGASRFFPIFRYEAKAPTSERPRYWRASCSCETVKPCADTSQHPDTDASPSTDDKSSNTSTFGNSTTDEPSPLGTTYTTGTATSSTMTSPTSSSSRNLSTSASTPGVSSATVNGGNPAASAASSSPSPSTTGTSAPKAGRSTDAAAPATSRGWSETSVCGECDAPARREAHPTTKPLDLMRWLVRLVTPPGGTVLDPFAGSGTTGEAAIVEGFRAILIEREADYLPLIVARLTRRTDPAAYAAHTRGDEDDLLTLLDGDGAA